MLVRKSLGAHVVNQSGSYDSGEALQECRISSDALSRGARCLGILSIPDRRELVACAQPRNPAKRRAFHGNGFWYGARPCRT